MPVKKDPSGRRYIQVEVEVPGTPEEVWRAIATGRGISAWFVPTKSEEREGGQLVHTFGPGMDCPAKITAWRPPKLFAAEGDLGMPGSPTMATEWSVEARAGGVCVVRVVHSLFASTSDWDNQLEGMEQGWPTYFQILRIWLTHFRGLSCSSIQLLGMSSDDEATAWKKLGGTLGLTNVAKGQKWTTPAGVPRMAGDVESVGKGMHPNTVLLRLDTPAPGSAYVGAFSCGGMIQAAVSIYLYGDGARSAVERDEPAWQKLMGSLFPAG